MYEELQFSSMKDLYDSDEEFQQAIENSLNDADSTSTTISQPT
jgi:hypothetical protein